MNIQRWLARREPNWQQLETILRQLEKKGLKSLTAAQIRQLASLYRSVSADLARAKTHKVGYIIERDLQKLTSRSYTQIYQGSRHQEWKAVKQFYLGGFPQIVQQTWVYWAMATGLFLLGALVGWWYSWQDPAFISLVIPEWLINKVTEEQQLWMGSILGVEPVASSNIMINNISVAFNVIGGGIIAGIITAYILLLNGIFLGAVATLVAQNNLAYPFWGFVFPHGSLELPAIFLAGGAGLLIARGLLFPGKYRRVDAVKFYGTQAAKLVYGIVPMLIIAGVIEGFFSPSLLFPDYFKYVVGMAIFALLVIYCSRQPLRERQKPIDR
jgi:uncharacterized membrane protein SpoIIM required for sporulation